LTDARFSGVSTGACIGHIGPEALAGGPIGKLKDDDLIEIEINTSSLDGKINFIGTKEHRVSPRQGTEILKNRKLRNELKPDPRLPEDTRLWAALQNVSGGTWGGCVYEVEEIIQTLERGRKP
jgi:dihydroxyacid dehydratase/phosphogluconate dehydratase